MERRGTEGPDPDRRVRPLGPLTPARALTLLAAAEHATVVVREPAEGGAVVARGRGRLRIERTPDGAVTVRERGAWEGAGGGAATAYTDVARFSPSADGRSLDVAHMRRGDPVFLVRLEALPDGGLGSVDAHLCGADRYAATLDEEPGGVVVVAWTIRGPRKDQRVVRRYGPAPGP